MTDPAEALLRQTEQDRDKWKERAGYERGRCDALSARLAQAEQERDEAQKRGDHLERSRHEALARKRSVEARLRKYEDDR